jgi:hypothetical protein
MSNHTAVLAIFNDEISADAAAALLKESQLAKGDAIGVLALNERGELKADKVGKRSCGKGAGIGAVVALVTPVGLAAGLIGGGLLGALHHKNLGLSDADRERLRGELEGSKAAVGVLAPVGVVRRNPILSPMRLSRKPRRPPQRSSPNHCTSLGFPVQPPRSGSEATRKLLGYRRCFG